MYKGTLSARAKRFHERKRPPQLRNECNENAGESINATPCIIESHPLLVTVEDGACPEGQDVEPSD